MPSLLGAHGAKAPDSKPPFVIVAAGQVDVVLELELEEDVRVEKEEGGADEIGGIEEEAADEENCVLLGSSEVRDELWYWEVAGNTLDWLCTSDVDVDGSTLDEV